MILKVYILLEKKKMRRLKIKKISIIIQLSTGVTIQIQYIVQILRWMKVVYSYLEMRSIVDQRNKPYKFKGRCVDNKKAGFGIKVWEDNAYLKGYWNDNFLKGFAYFKNKDSKIFMGKILINQASSI